MDILSFTEDWGLLIVVILLLILTAYIFIETGTLKGPKERDKDG